MNKTKICIASILIILISIISVSVATAQNMTIPQNIKDKIKSDPGAQPQSINITKPPLYLFVDNPSVGTWCYGTCESWELDATDYLTLRVRVTNVKFQNWKDVPVTVQISGLPEQTKKTNSNGEALFNFDIGESWSYPSFGILVTATSTISGRKVWYWRSYNNDMPSSH